MKKGYAIALIGAVLSGLGLMQPGVSSAAIACPPAPAGPVVAGSVTVSGGFCDLTGKTVTGSVTVTGGVLQMNGTTVNGSVTQTGGQLYALNSTIKGSLTVTDTAAGSRNDICGGTIGGSVTVSGVTGPADGWFRLLGSDAFMPNGPCLDILGVPSSGFSPLRIGGSVRFINNQIYVRVSGAQQIGASVTVTNNSSAAYGNSADVSGNVIRGSLACTGNVPPPSGSGNTTTGSETGQCSTALGF